MPVSTVLRRTQHGRDGRAVPWWGGVHTSVCPLSPPPSCPTGPRGQGMCDDPPLRGRKHLRFVNAHWAKGITNVRWLTRDQKVLLVNYTLGMETSLGFLGGTFLGIDFSTLKVDFLPSM